MAGQLNPILFIACLFVGALCFSVAPVAGVDVDNADDTSGDTSNAKLKTALSPDPDSTKKREAGVAKPAPSTVNAKAAGQVQTNDEAKPDPLADLPTYGAALIRMVVALVSILIVLLILAKLLPRWLNRSFGQKSKGDISIVDSIQLEPRRRVYLLRVGGRQVLIGSSEQGLHTLVGEIPNGEVNAKASEEDDSDAAIIQPEQQPGHQPSSLATPFESVMKSKDGSRADLRENG